MIFLKVVSMGIMFCFLGLNLLNFLIIPRLKKYSLLEYRKAGEPSPFWSDLRQLKFAKYIMNKEFHGIPDKKLVLLFAVARLLLIVLFLSFALFIISLAILIFIDLF